ncbi:hypothetical protein LCGC14_0417950 [marine sediment metagenome]|uniref:AP2/ERF domain-containing protein n=1 Tax=marine sediment metagenome TaxID=412755 RepID=A0A0F9SXR0_9ZZZZ
MKEIILTRGYKAVVDDDDYPKLSIYRWYASGSGRYVYAGRKVKGKYIALHREIMGTLDCDRSVEVDHINHDTLDNRKKNLRVGDKSMNQSNNLGHRGAWWQKQNKRWCARIKFRKVRYNLGCYATKDEAQNACDKKRSKIRKENGIKTTPLPKK